MNRKIYVVGNSYDYANWMGGKITGTIEEADLVLFTGGTDVSSRLYDEVRHPEADSPDVQRDVRETSLFSKARNLGIPIIGICRGSQLVCALSGGKLVQHQEHQPSRHNIITNDGQVVMATSSHHQAQYPYHLREGVDYKLIAWTEGLSSFHFDGNEEELNPEKEAEIVIYPKSKALAIQSHPEWMLDHPDIEYYRNLLDNFLAEYGK